MKRFILAILLLSLFGFSSSTFAYDTCDANNPFVPCSYNGNDFDSYVGNDNQEGVFFNLATLVSIDYHFYDDTRTSIFYNAGYPYGIRFLPQWPYEDLTLYYWGVAGNSDILHNGQTNYSQTVTGYLELGGGINPSKTITISRSPELGGGVSDYPTGENILCGVDGHNECSASYPLNTEVTLDAYPNEGYEFSHWEINDLAMADVDGSIPVTMNENKNVVAVFYLKADDFVFPVLAQGVTDPLLNNTLNPDENGWHGSDVGELAKYEGHLGQDYSVDSGSSAGKPVYAVANGTIVEIMNDPNYLYGWCDNEDHGWGPVVVIRHENRDGFNTSSSIVTDSCDTETSPTVIYSLYGHLSKTSIQNLQIGQTVTKGQPLGELGTPGTDWSTTINMPAHLHFEIKDEVGFLEGSWYVTHPGECPQETSQNCNAEGIGRGYSHSNGFAPHRYSPDEFIFNN